MWFKKKKAKEISASKVEIKDDIKVKDTKIENKKTPTKSKTSKSATSKENTILNAKKSEKDSTDKKNISKTSSKTPKTEKTAVTEEKKEKKAIYRVIYDKEARLWRIKKDGAKRIIDSKPTKEEALARVNELCESGDMKYIVHKKDGKFQKK